MAEDWPRERTVAAAEPLQAVGGGPGKRFGGKQFNEREGGRIME